MSAFDRHPVLVGGALVIVVTLLVVAFAFGVAFWVDSTLMCPPGAVTVYDFTGLKVGCIGGGS